MLYFAFCSAYLCKLKISKKVHNLAVKNSIEKYRHWKTMTQMVVDDIDKFQRLILLTEKNKKQLILYTIHL